MNNIYCKCGNSFDKQEFKKHFRQCICLIKAYEDFNFKTVSLIKQNYSINGLNIIKCLLESFIKLINIQIQRINDEKTLEKKSINDIEKKKIIGNNDNDNNKLNNDNKSMIKNDNENKINDYRKFLTKVGDMNDENKNQQSKNEEYNKKNIYSLFNNSLTQDYKKADYVEDITKKIFVLLYFNEQRIKNELKKEIKDNYNLKNYYLINSDWLKHYKEYFYYEKVKEKLINQMNLNEKEYSYQQIQFNLNNIVKEIDKISLFHEDEIDNYIRNGNNLIPKINKITLKKEDNKDESFEHEENDFLLIPYGFDIITDDIYELLLQEKFFFNLNDNVKNKIKYQLLIGNNQIILKNLNADNEGNIINYSNNYCFYIDKDKKIDSLGENDIDKNDPFIIYYVLNYEEDKNFYKYLEYINKEKGFKEFISRFDINKIYYQQNIEKNKNIGKFINIRIN